MDGDQACTELIWSLDCNASTHSISERDQVACAANFRL